MEPTQGGDAMTDTHSSPTPSQNGTKSVDVVVIDAEQEKKITKELLQSRSMKAGDTWYLVSCKWWCLWKDYVGLDTYSYSRFYYEVTPRASGQRPGPIENSFLVDDNMMLRKAMLENSDYVLVSEEIWNNLIKWYGGGPPLPRKAITYGRGYMNSVAVEVRPMQLTIIRSSKPQENTLAYFSKADTVAHFKTTLCDLLKVSPDNVRVWDYHQGNRLKLLNDPDERLDDVQIIDGQLVLLEEKLEDGTWPPSSRASTASSDDSYSYGSSYGNYYGSSSRSSPSRPGITGLSNLGNTCFMNSSLQCLSNTPPLAEFFVNNNYQQDINILNPLGTKGKLAEEFAKLCKELWGGLYGAVAPRDFKSKLERFAPQFAGYQQHDSQELLAFLLDGLHEDLNRVKDKPYTETTDSDSRPDAEVAQEAWKRHKSRNDSFIVDWFQGQLKSTLVCPDCAKIAITFDPFMYLGLPLPMKITRNIPVTMYRRDGSNPPVKYGCSVPKFGCILDLKKSLAQLCGLRVENVVLTDVYNSKFFKKFNDNESLDAITERDVTCAYEIVVPGPDEEDRWDTVYCPVYHRKDEIVQYNYYMGSSKSTRQTLFGMPFIISVPSKVTYKELYNLVVQHVRRYLKMVDVEPESVNGYQSDSESSDEDGIKVVRSSRRPQSQQSSQLEVRHPLFVIKAVDSYGLNDQAPLLDNDLPLNLEDRQGLVIHWSNETLEKVYDEDKDRESVVHSSFRNDDSQEEENIHIDRCLELFTESEQLGPDDPWYCNRCGQFRQATKKFDIWSCPRVLVIHLKRFSYRNKYYREKLETHVDFPTKGLDMSRLVLGPCDQPPIYDLYAVSNHYGSMSGGHYTAYALNKIDNKWYKFDDSFVSEVDEASVVSSSAYVLFYRRRDTISKPIPSPPPAQSEPEPQSSTPYENANVAADQEIDSAELQPISSNGRYRRFHHDSDTDSSSEGDEYG